MSHYTLVETEFKDKECLVKALGKVGYSEVEIHDGEGKNLYGYRGDMRPEKANVIVRREHVGRAANDLGFVWNHGKRCFTAIISEYDTRSKHVNFDRLTQQYSNAVIIKEVTAKGFSIMYQKKKEGKMYVRARRAY